MQLNPPPTHPPHPPPTPRFMLWQPKLNLRKWQRTDDAQELLLQKQSVTACTVTYRAIVISVCHIHVILRCLSHPCDTEQHVAATGLQTKPKLRTNATEYLQPLPDLPSRLLQADQSMFCAVWINLYQLSEHAWSFSLSLSLPFFVFWVCYCELL